LKNRNPIGIKKTNKKRKKKIQKNQTKTVSDPKKPMEKKSQNIKPKSILKNKIKIKRRKKETA